MSPAASTRGLSTLAVFFAVLLAAPFLLVAALVYRTGVVSIRVQQKRSKGPNIRLIVPAALIPLAMSFVPAEKLAQPAREFEPWLPAMEIASRELAHCPDGPLVEVESRKDKVRIAKAGGSLVIDVDSVGETVHVSFPLAMARYVAQKLRAGLPPV